MSPDDDRQQQSHGLTIAGTDEVADPHDQKNHKRGEAEEAVLGEEPCVLRMRGEPHHRGPV